MNMTVHIHGIDNDGKQMCESFAVGSHETLWEMPVSLRFVRVTSIVIEKDAEPSFGSRFFKPIQGFGPPREIS